MPRIKDNGFIVDADIRIGLWKVTENQEEMFSEFPSLSEYSSEYEKFKSPMRRMEYLVERALLQEMLGKISKLSHSASGKPLLSDGKKVSISHTIGLVAVILSEKYDVAVDVEYQSERVCRISDKFLRKDEHVETMLQKLLVWCAKETLYKLHSEDKLTFQDMQVVSVPDFDACPSGFCYIDNLKTHKRIKVEYIMVDGYVLTYAVDKTR